MDKKSCTYRHIFPVSYNNTSAELTVPLPIPFPLYIHCTHFFVTVTDAVLLFVTFTALAVVGYFFMEWRTNSRIAKTHGFDFYQELERNRNLSAPWSEYELS